MVCRVDQQRTPSSCSVPSSLSAPPQYIMQAKSKATVTDVLSPSNGLHALQTASAIGSEVTLGA